MKWSYLKIRSALVVLCLASATAGPALAGTSTVNYASVYAVDYSNHYSSTLPSARLVAATNQDVFTYYGFPVTNYVTNSLVCASGLSAPGLSAFPPIQVSFDLIGTNCEFVVNARDYTVTNVTPRVAYFAIKADGVSTSYTNEVAGVSHATWYVPITFYTNGVHHIYFTVHGNFAGVNVTTGNSAAQYQLTNPKPNLLIVEGDSYVQGYNPNVSLWGNNSYWYDGWVWQLANLVSNTIPLPSGLGGTGFVSQNNGATSNYVQRVQTDICAVYSNAVNSGLYNQIFITAQGSINDGGASSNLCYQNATNVYMQIQAACPQAHIFFVGNWLGVGGRSSPLASDLALEWAMTNAASALSLPMYDPIAANVKNASNYSIFYGSPTDSVHPGGAGYAIMANWINTNLTFTFGTNWNSSAQNGSGTKFYSLTVNNGSGGGYYTNGQSVTISATTNLTSHFANWTGLNIADTNSPVTTITMPASVLVVTANLVTPPPTAALNATDFGAVGDAEEFIVSTTSNSPMVSVLGTNIFSSADIGKVIEIFRTGPWTYWSNNPAYGFFSTNQDTVCLITNVTDGTNLWCSIPQGWTTNTYCIVGSNNRDAFQAAINVAEANVSATNPNVTIHISDGTYLIIGAKELNANYIAQAANDADSALTINSGGLTLLGDSTNTVLMGCGAGMEHQLWNGGNPANASPYGRSGAWVPCRGTLFVCSGPIANSQYPLVFQNLTLDGGVTNGLQTYTYWIASEGSGDGWDMTHHAVLDFNPFGTPGDPRLQMHQLKVFTNCVFQHWRGEMLICTTSTGGTNTCNDIANCTFYDGNATADNMYYGQHVHGCVFSRLVKVMEYYQANALLPMLFENNLWTNIVSNPLSIVGAMTNALPPPFTIYNNACYGMNGNQISLSPAQNVTVISNQFYGGGACGVAFTGVGMQGNAIISNIVVAANQFIGTVSPIYMDGTPVRQVAIFDNVVRGATGTFATCLGGWKYNIIFSNNISGGAMNSVAVGSGQYFFDDPSDKLGAYYVDAYVPGLKTNIPNCLTYGWGSFHAIGDPRGICTNFAYYLDDSKPNLIPNGAILRITNQSPANILVYASTNLMMQTNLPGHSMAVCSWNGNVWLPQNQFSASPTAGRSSFFTQFNGPSVDNLGNAISSWSWNFGDGSSSTAQNPSHTYIRPGTYSPTLWVVDSAGQSISLAGPAVVVTPFSDAPQHLRVVTP